MCLENAPDERAQHQTFVVGLAGELVDGLGFESKRKLLKAELGVNLLAGAAPSGVARVGAELAALPLVDVIEKLLALLVGVVVGLVHGGLSGAEVSPKKGEEATARLKGLHTGCANWLNFMANPLHIIPKGCARAAIKF